MNNPGLIAIVGRPNVGKSALFNRIAGRRIAIVHDMPGVTRDRVSAEVEWHGRPFTLVDTGGIGLVPGEKSDDVIATSTVEQVNIAIEAADVILFVVDVREGIVPLDQEVAQHLRRSGKPVHLIANKADTAPAADSITDFASLGFEEMHPVSALHDRGISPVMETALKHLPEPTEKPLDTQPSTLNLAIVGRPNVGKSSLINALTQSDRVIVSNIPGTTRDAVDVPFTIETDGRQQPGLLIDTAGLRKKRRVKDSLEYFSVTRTRDAIDRCDIAVLVLDAVDGILEQDKKIADLFSRRNRACILVVNKWDLALKAWEKGEIEGFETESEFRKAFEKGLRREIFFTPGSPVRFVSALENIDIEKMLYDARQLDKRSDKKIPTGPLNNLIYKIAERMPAPKMDGRRFRVYYAVHTGNRPYRIKLFCNQAQKLAASYRRFLQASIVEAFKLEGCPVVFDLVNKKNPYVN